MLMLGPIPVVNELIQVKPTESKKSEPSTYEFNKKIHFAQLPYVPSPTIDYTQDKVETKVKALQRKQVKVKSVSIEDSTEAKKRKIANKINEHLGGKLEDKGIVFAQTAMENSIDPYLVAAIAIHETGNGESNAIQNKNNVGGMMGSKGLKRFSSVNESIEILSALIKNSYVDNGLDTIREISRKYAPIGADNDPNGLNDDWVSGVSSIYNMLKYTSL